MPKLLDENLQQQLNEKGYVILDLLSKEEIETLQKGYPKNIEIEAENFMPSNYLHDHSLNHQVNQHIKSVLIPKVNELFHNAKCLVGLYYTKPPGTKSSFYMHRDWSIVEESTTNSYNLWAPLIDVDAYNGGLYVVPETHKKTRYRGSPGFHYPNEGLLRNVLYTLKRQKLKVKAGQAVLFFHSLLHGSGPNRTRKARVAAGISIISKTARVIHYHRHSNKRIEMFEVDEEFYQTFNFTKPSADLKSLGMVK